MATGEATRRSGTFAGRVDAVDATIHRWLVKHSVVVLRVSLGAIFLAFGVLKLFPEVSPAEGLVRTTADAITFGLVPGSVVLVATALVEVVIGLTFVTGRFMRAAVWLLTVQLVGVLSPLVVLTARLFDGPYHAPTLEGQYVIKDVILVAAGMVVSSTVRGGRLVRGPRSAKPTADAGQRELGAHEKLDIVLDAIRNDRPVADVCREHDIDEADLRRWREEMLDGAARAMAGPGEGPGPER